MQTTIKTLTYDNKMLSADTVAMAREAGFQTGTVASQNGNGTFPFVRPLVDGNCLVEIERLVKVAMAAGAAVEREECAKLCDDMDDDVVDGYAGWQYGEAIRSRGEA